MRAQATTQKALKSQRRAVVTGIFPVKLSWAVAGIATKRPAPTETWHPEPQMLHYLKLLAIVVPVVLAIDLIWLGYVMIGFYDQQLGDLARRHGTTLAPRWGAAFLVYLLIPGGIVFFVRPLLGDANLLEAFGWGAAYGLVVYGVYDLTNLATLDKWSWKLTLADIAWGCVLCGIGGVVLRMADRWLR